MLVQTPSNAQNSRLVSVTTTTNLCDSAAGTSLWDSGASGAPIRWGSAIRPRPRNSGPRGGAEGQQAKPSGRCGRRGDPPGLPRRQFGHWHARQFRWQSEAGCRRKHDKAREPPEQTLPPRYRQTPDRIDTGEQQREADRGQDVGRDRKSVALNPVFGLPGAVMAGSPVVIMRRGDGLLCGGGLDRDRCLAFVDFALLNQRHRSEELRNRDRNADD